MCLGNHRILNAVLKPKKVLEISRLLSEGSHESIRWEITELCVCPGTIGNVLRIEGFQLSQTVMGTCIKEEFAWLVSKSCEGPQCIFNCLQQDFLNMHVTKSIFLTTYVQISPRSRFLKDE